jgi:hypothetical protein
MAAGGNNGSGLNGLPPLETPTPIYDQAMAEVIQLSGGGLHSPNPQLRQEALLTLQIKDNELQKIYNKYIEQVRNLYGDCANEAEREFTHGRPAWMFTQNFDTMHFNIIKHIEKKCSMPKNAPNGNLLKFPSLQNNLAGIFSAGGGGSAVRHQKRKQRKTQKRKNRRNRTRKN